MESRPTRAVMVQVHAQVASWIRLRPQERQYYPLAAAAQELALVMSCLRLRPPPQHWALADSTGSSGPQGEQQQGVDDPPAPLAGPPGRFN